MNRAAEESYLRPLFFDFPRALDFPRAPAPFFDEPRLFPEERELARLLDFFDEDFFPAEDFLADDFFAPPDFFLAALLELAFAGDVFFAGAAFFAGAFLAELENFVPDDPPEDFILDDFAALPELLDPLLDPELLGPLIAGGPES